MVALILPISTVVSGVI